MFLMHIFFLVQCMWAVPDPSSVILSHHKCSSTSNMEQVVILTLCGKDTSQGLSLLHRVLTEGEWSSAVFLRAQPVQGLELEVAVNKQNTVSNNHSLHTLMKENISEYVSELFLSPPPPLKKKLYSRWRTTCGIRAAWSEASARTDSTSGSGTESIRGWRAAASRQPGQSDVLSCPGVWA